MTGRSRNQWVVPTRSSPNPKKHRKLHSSLSLCVTLLSSHPSTFLSPLSLSSCSSAMAGPPKMAGPWAIPPGGDQHPMIVPNIKRRNFPLPKTTHYKPIRGQPHSLQISKDSSISVTGTIPQFYDLGQHMLPRQEAPDDDVSPLKEKHLNAIATLVSSSGKPVLYVGGGCQNLNLSECGKFVELTGIPVAVTLMDLAPFRVLDDLVVLGFEGDDDYIMNFQELATVREGNLPDGVTLLDDKRLNMVFQLLDVAQVVMNEDLRAAIQKIFDTPGAQLVLPIGESVCNYLRFFVIFSPQFHSEAVSISVLEPARIEGFVFICSYFNLLVFLFTNVVSKVPPQVIICFCCLLSFSPKL